MHVDGFRFDLAATLARELYDVDKLSSFFDMVQQDPVISRVKLMADLWALVATTWATFRRNGPNGTASSATPSATFGAASPPHWASSPHA